MTDKKQPGKKFVLYDGRARFTGTEDAAVMITADTEAECRETGDEYGADTLWFEYDIIGDELWNEKARPDLSTRSMRGIAGEQAKGS